MLSEKILIIPAFNYREPRSLIHIMVSLRSINISNLKQFASEKNDIK